MLEEILNDVDLVLVMTVNPGFGGQDFIPESVDKIAALKKMLAARKKPRRHDVHIEVDGGIHVGTIAAAEKAGATLAVCGTAVFNKEASVAENIAALRKAAEN